ncbi:MAG: hypothetical protein PHG74_11175, partial [Kiritimatiellae bacterium]|nr:hypothetical protein [Kiritimatiellia bacterium]MDD3584563.1 hypothetical protein [Kiritimatiellia bacterium]
MLMFHSRPPASGQRNAGRWLAGARFLQVLNEGHFGMREGAGKGMRSRPLLENAAHTAAARKAPITSLGVFQPR